ncbi:MAG TPA: DUF2490 domain-containing protein [Ktedonobacteraceae bacterium]
MQSCAIQVLQRYRPLSGSRNVWIGLALLMPMLGLRASGQVDEFLPEIDAHYKLASDVRVSFQAKGTREGGDPTQAEIGPSIDFYLKPLLKLKNVTLLDLNDSKSRPLVLSIGYRYLSSPNSPATNRIAPVATLHFPLTAGFLLSDRNRADLDWKSGKFSWRYRNRLQIEKRLTIHSYHPAPYASAEFYYQSQYSKWSDTAIYAGCLFPIGKHVEFDPYYEHQNNTGKAPNQQLNQLGLVLSLYF